MNKSLPLTLILGGTAIAVLSWYGYSALQKPSDEEILRAAMQQEAERQAAAAEEADRLRQTALPAPAACQGVTTGFIYAICETEPDPGRDWPDWTALANAAEQACLTETFHQTNTHALAIRREQYEATQPDANRMGRFASDLCGASLFTDGVDWGDTDKPASTLIEGFYADRAESRFAPEQDY